MNAWTAFAPSWVLLGTALVVLLLDLWTKRRGILTALALGGTMLAGVVGLAYLHQPDVVWQGLLHSTPLSRGLAVTFVGLTFLAVVGSAVFSDVGRTFRGEVYTLILFAAFAMTLIAAALDLVILFIAVEIVSLASYALIAHVRTAEGRLEAGVKYMLLGALGSALFLMGIAFFYGVAGTTHLDPREWSIQGEFRNAGMILSTVFFVAGLGFKIACVPFHAYAPDVYQGAPPAISGFLAGASKMASFLALYLIARVWITPEPNPWPWLEGEADVVRSVIRILAGATMIWGTLLGIVQTQVKRVLAYSSIAHTGYLLMILLVPSEGAAAILAFYLAVYAVTKAGAFLCITIYEAKRDEKLHLDDLAALRQESPALALALGVFLFSLAGAPPTAGFIAKFYLFKQAIVAGETPLVIIAVLSSVVAAGFYLRLTVAAFFSPIRAVARGEMARYPLLKLSAIAGMVVALLLGVFPQLGRLLLP